MHFLMNKFFMPYCLYIRVLTFYFVSDSSEVIKLLFFFHFHQSSPFFSNFQIFAILIIFLDRMDGLLLKYDMKIFIFFIFRKFQISAIFPSNIQILAILTIFLTQKDGLLLKYDMRILFSGNFSGFGIFSGFSFNLQISAIWIH